MGARKRNSTKWTEETLKWNKVILLWEGSRRCWNHLLRQDTKPLLFCSHHYWPGNLRGFWRIQCWLSPVRQAVTPASPVTHNESLPPAHRALEVLAHSWLLSHRWHSSGMACWLLSSILPGVSGLRMSAWAISSQTVNLNCLCAQHNGQSTSTKSYTSTSTSEFSTSRYKMHLFFLEAWAVCFLLWVPCPHLSTEWDPLVQASISLKRQPLALRGKDILKTNGEFCFVK